MHLQGRNQGIFLGDDVMDAICPPPFIEIRLRDRGKFRCDRGGLTELPCGYAPNLCTYAPNDSFS